MVSFVCTLLKSSKMNGASMARLKTTSTAKLNTTAAMTAKRDPSSALEARVLASWRADARVRGFFVAVGIVTLPIKKP
jgi:hypothetical protein